MSTAATGQGQPPATPAGRAGVDAQDLVLLRLLATDARLSQRRLAREVGMSPPAVAERVARMERAGVIRGYRTEIDWATLGHPLVVFLSVVAVQGGDQYQVIAALRELPEVEDVQVVTGPMDLIVRLRLRDHEHLREALFERIWKLDGVERTETLISLASMPTKHFDLDLLTRLAASGTARAVHNDQQEWPDQPDRRRITETEKGQA